MAELCDMCGIRPATVRVRVNRDGETEILELCEVDYRRLAARQRASSPMESLFGSRGSLFEEMFGGDPFAGSVFGRGAADRMEASAGGGAAGDGGGRQIPVGGGGGGDGGGNGGCASVPALTAADGAGERVEAGLSAGAGRPRGGAGLKTGPPPMLKRR